MDWGSVLAALIAPAAAIVSSVLGLRLANKLGIGPVQGQYVDILRELNSAKDEKIRDLESRVDELEKERAEDREEISDLRQEVFDLRKELSERRGRRVKP